eukprot:Em0020g670a
MNQPNTDGSTASVDTQPSHPAPFLAEQETEQHREHEDSQDETSSQSQLRMEQGTSTAQSQIVEQHGSSPFTESESHVFSRFAQEAVLRHRKSTLQWAHNPPDQAAALHHRECPTRGTSQPGGAVLRPRECHASRYKPHMHGAYTRQGAALRRRERHASRYKPQTHRAHTGPVQIENLEFIETYELLQEAWLPDPTTEAASHGLTIKLPAGPQVSQCGSKSGQLGHSTAMLGSHMTDQLYRQQAAATRSLSWDTEDHTLYNEAFSGRAKPLARCRGCLSKHHSTDTCPDAFLLDSSSDAASRSAVSSNQPKSDLGLDAYLVPHFTKEEQTHTLTLMVRAHSAGLLPFTLNDIPEFREYINYISKGRYTLPHRTKTTELEDTAILEKRDVVASSVKQSTSISLTTYSVTLPTGESFVAVTGHLIDRVPLKNAGKCYWKLLSAVLAVSVDNESHTAENIASLLKVPKHQIRDFIQLFCDMTNSIWNSPQRLEHLKHLQRMRIKADKDLLDRLTDDGFGKRFDLTSALLTDAALVHPGHKSLSWLPPQDKEEAIKQFVDELVNVASTCTTSIIQSSVANTITTVQKIPLDSFFDFEQGIEDVLTVMAKSLREKLMDEFQEYMSVTMTNWRVNNVMEWWSKKEEKFPNIAKFARKYLAVPTSSAPSQSLLADETHSRT